MKHILHQLSHLRTYGTIVLYLFLFIISLSFLSGYVLNFCSVPSELHFDAQNFFTWQYGGLEGYIPYKEYFYPYGILVYYQDIVLAARMFSWVWMALLLLVTSFLIHKITKSAFFAIVTFVLSLIALQFDTQYWYFLRYGTTITAVCGVVYWWSTIRDRRGVVFAGGIVSGFIFSLLTIQGVYIFLSLGALFTIDWVWSLLEKNGRSFWNICLDFVRTLLIFCAGNLVGALPLFVYLVSHHAVNDFFFFFRLLFTMHQTGKVPFFPGGWIVENTWGIITLWIVGTILLYRWFFNRKNLRTTETYVFVAVWILLLLFEQKNFMRPPVGYQIMHLIVVVGVLCFHFLYRYFSERGFLKFWIRMYICMLIFGFALFAQQTSFFYYEHSMFAQILSTKWMKELGSKAFLSTTEQCLKDDMSEQLQNASHNYRSVLSFLEKQPDYNGKLFSYPADPVMYFFVHQVPAPFFNGYDASPLSAQQKNIEYIQEQDIRYIVYNLQERGYDGVPHVFRNATFLHYMLTMYDPLVIVDGRLIWKRKNT